MYIKIIKLKEREREREIHPWLKKCLTFKLGIIWIHMCVIIIYIYIYMGWVQVTPGVTLSNVTPPNNLLLN